jgi:phosphotriesterase-related protein
MTVLGPIPATELGVTLAHEHCFIDASVWFVEPTEASRRVNVDRPVDMSLLSALRHRPFSTTRDNMTLNDEELIRSELENYHREGGVSVVDVTPIALGRDPKALQRLSRATGLNIVLATGIYVENAHPEWVWGMDADQIAEVFTREITEGIDGTDVRCGLIGEIGLAGIPRGGGRVKSAAMTDEEEKVLRGAARASLQTGLAVSVHLDPIEPRAAVPALTVLKEEGVDPTRIIIGHMDQVGDFDYHLAVVESGAFIEYDSLGREHYSHEWGDGFDWGHDSWRMRFAARLIAEGYGNQLLFSQDVCLKTDLVHFGGPGYGHVLRNVVPGLTALGVERRDIDTILIDNPERAFGVETDVWANAAASVEHSRVS